MAPATTTIRPATLADVSALVTMGVRFIRETQYAPLITVNPLALRALAVQLIESVANPSILLVAERDGVLIGMFGLMVYPHPMSWDRTAAELMWWSDSPGYGMRLFRAGKRWAIDQGAVILQMIAPTEEVAAIYMRVGFKPVETTWQCRLDGSA